LCSYSTLEIIVIATVVTIIIASVDVVVTVVAVIITIVTVVAVVVVTKIAIVVEDNAILIAYTRIIIHFWTHRELLTAIFPRGDWQCGICLGVMLLQLLSMLLVKKVC
jgi:hypothetical protein